MRIGLSTDVRDIILPDVYIGDAMHDCTGGALRETEDGFVLEIPAGDNKTIEITSQYAKDHHTKITIKAGENAKAMITRMILGLEKGTVKEELMVEAAPGARITYNEVQRLPKTMQWHSTKTGMAREGATINWYTQVTGSKTDHHAIKNTLATKAKTTILCTTSIDGDQHSQALMQTVHEGEETTSGMYAKTIVSGKARTLHKGLVRIEPSGSEAAGYQQEDALIIGQQAQANAMPELEIENPNVTCSHGSTIGHLDEEQLFYLRSRGLSKEDATRLITASFLRSITAHADSEWATTINALLEEEP